MSLSTTALFCCLDDFARAYEDGERHRLIPTGRKRRREGKLSLGEMLFIMVLFHLSSFKDFKYFWVHGVEQKSRDCFGDLPTYARFVALMPRLFTPFCVLIHSLSGEETGIYIADSTKLAARANPRISRNKTFRGQRHAVICVAGLEGKRLVDKGYISKKLFAKLWDQGLHLITGIRRNMKNYLMPILDKLLLRKRFIVETLFDKLKSEMGLEHTRHRSPTNAFVHILSCLVAYMLGKTKIRMKNIAYP